MSDRIRAQTRARPGHPALIHGERVETYGSLDQSMDKIAGALQREGLQPQDVVAICASTWIQYVEVFCGAIRAVVVTAPLAPLSTPQSLVDMIKDCGAQLLYIDKTMARHLTLLRDQITARWISLDDGSFAQPMADWLTQAPAPVSVLIKPDWSFDIIYSSGTIGTPKGIVQPHVMRTRPAPVDEPFGYGPEATALISTGLYSNTTLVSLFPALGSGSSVVLKADGSIRGETLREEVNARLGKTQRITSITFLNTLPRSHSGKVLKRELREWFRQSLGEQVK